MMTRYILISIFFNLISFVVFGQTPESEVIRYEDISFIENGVTLSIPYASGLNSPLYSEADLNNDGILDLFIYDRDDDSGNYVFRTGPNQYFSDFENQNNLPPLVGFGFMYDYNCDDVPDLFTSSNTIGGIGNLIGADIIKVYNGAFDGNNNLTFTLAKEKLTTINGVDLFSLTDNVPSIIDIDQDGDLDILTFKSNAGRQIAFYKNQSMELYNHCDSLVFELITDCHGEFTDDGTTPLTLDTDCGPRPDGDPVSLRHGVSSLLSFDENGDGIYELMIGNEFFNTISVLFNDGTANDAHFFDQDNSYPSNTTSINIQSLPTPSMVDVNMDGVGEILISNRSTASSQNYATTIVYQRDETQNFDLIQDTFLVKNMIDVGEDAAPVFFDFDQDGLTDLLVGSSGYFNPLNGLAGGITAYRNIGDANNPAFRLVDRNFENVEVYDWNEIAPTFGDLDGDGDQDMIIGEASGKIHYFENIAGSNNPVTFATAIPEYQGIDIGKNATPQLIDLNFDGLLDLVIGTDSGFLVYYPNNGTATNPVFDEEISELGDVDTRFPGQSAGFSAPFFSDLENPGTYLLYAASESGFIFRYDDIAGNLSVGSVFNELTNTFADIRIGNRSRINMADIDNDGRVEMVVGNTKGGIAFYKFGLPVSTFDLSNEADYIVSPNPSDHNFFISGPDLQSVENVQIYTVDGKQIATHFMNAGNRLVVHADESIQGGLYFMEIQFSDKWISKKIVKN